jgi:hypothetical protein
MGGLWRWCKATLRYSVKFRRFEKLRLQHRTFPKEASTRRAFYPPAYSTGTRCASFCSHLVPQWRMLLSPRL